MQSTTSQHQRSNTSIACQECKRRKSKCTGYPAPCVQCRDKRTVCRFQPGGDLRRRESRHNFKACKTLLDFVESIRDGDFQASKELYQAVLRTDLSGKLPKVAQMYANAIGMDVSLQDGTNGHSDTSVQSIKEHKTSTTALSTDASSEASVEEFSFQVSPSEEFPEVRNEVSLQIVMNQSQNKQKSEVQNLQVTNASSFNDLPILWAKINKANMEISATIEPLPELVCEWHSHHLSLDDLLTRSILSFTDAARKEILSNVDVFKLIETATPRLDNFFHPSHYSNQEHTAWSWACRFAYAFPNLPLPLRLAMIYISGMLMRFFICPCIETYNDLPLVLKPSDAIPETVSPCAIETTLSASTPNISTTKSFFFGHRDRYGNFAQKTSSALSSSQSEQIQSLNWPYSNSACLAFHSGTGSSSFITLSKAFIEHIQMSENYFISIHGMLGSTVQDAWTGD